MGSGEKKRRLRCASRGPRNNGLIKKCTFEEDFPDKKYRFVCPVCNGPLRPARQKKTTAPPLRDLPTNNQGHI